MDITEKVNLTTGTGWGSGPCVGNTGSVPRLGIPSLCLHDGSNGIRFTDYATHFPSGLATGATLNKDLMYLKGKAVCREMKAKNVHIILGPVVGPIGLKAQGGRNWESFGADPYLQGVAGAEFVRGCQEEGVVAVARHLVGYEQEHFRQVGEWDVKDWSRLDSSVSANIGDRAMHEVYMWPFADLVHAGVGGVLCSYNMVNNTYACENLYLLNYLLKEELGFQGFVSLDWGAQHSGVTSALTGLDMSMPGDVFNEWLSGKSPWGPLLTRAVYNQTVSQERLDDMACRILAPFFSSKHLSLPTEDDVPNFSSWTYHTFGQRYPYQHTGAIEQLNLHRDARSEFSDDVALGIAREAVVLLKNCDQHLPIAKEDGIRRLTVFGIGAFASSSGLRCKDQRCTDGVITSGWGSAAVHNPMLITPADAIAKKCREQGIVFDSTSNNWDLPAAEDLADYADMAVVVVGAASGEGFIEVDKNYGDRKNLTLWHNGEALIESVTKRCRRVVVVVNAVGPVDMEAWIDNDNVVAVLYVPPLGQFTGQAIAEILFGEVNPSGKLPFTIAKKKLHYVPILESLSERVDPQDIFERGVYLDYRFLDKHTIKPRFAFGYGLSYTHFSYLDLKIKEVRAPTEYLPCPDEYLPPYRAIQDDMCDPEDALFPHEEFDPVPGFIYPYLFNENIRLLDIDEKFEYPRGWSPDYRKDPPLAGGGLGGNPALWDVLYHVTAGVTNEGKQAGAVAVQLYIELPSTTVASPPRILRGFDKVYLESGEKSEVSFEILHRDISIWDTSLQQWIIQTGTYKIYVSSSSLHIELCGEIDIGVGYV